MYKPEAAPPAERTVIASMVYRKPGDASNFVAAVEGVPRRCFEAALLSLLQIMSNLMAARVPVPVTKPEGMKTEGGGWISGTLVDEMIEVG